MNISQKDFLLFINSLNFKNKTIVFDMDHTLILKDISILMMNHYGYLDQYDDLIKKSNSQEGIIEAYKFSVECFVNHLKEDLQIVLNKFLTKELYREYLIIVIQKILQDQGTILVLSASWIFFVEQVIQSLNQLFHVNITQYYGSTIKHNLSFQQKQFFLEKKNIIPYMVFGDSENDFFMMRLSEYGVFVRSPREKYSNDRQKILFILS